LTIRDTLYAISSAGLTLATGTTEDTLKVYPAEKLTPELSAAIKEHKAEIIKIMREDEEMRRTGIIQSKRQVFDLARDVFSLDKSGAAREQFQCSHHKRARASCDCRDERASKVKEDNPMSLRLPLESWRYAG
jgi:hypothetical protein